MKKLLFYLYIPVVLGVIAFSCSQRNNSKNVAEEHNDDKFNKANEEKFAQYLVDTYSSGLFEQKAAEVAKTRATQKDVKALADKLADSHKKLNDEVKKIANSRQVTLPDDLSPNQHDKLQNMMEKKGMDFDKEFIDEMVSYHKDDISTLEKVSGDSTDADLKKFASNSLPAIREHLDKASIIQDQLKNK